MKVNPRHSLEIAIQHQEFGVSLAKLCEKYKNYSRATVYRHSKIPVGQSLPVDKRKYNRGRPTKLSKQDERAILRAVPKLRQTEGSFTTPRIAVEAGVSKSVSNRTVRRVLNKNGYHYCRSRKKGLLKASDLKARLAFCKKIKSKYNLNEKFWTEQISMYLDGKGFMYKTNPLDQAKSPKSREWRKRSEGLDFGCTSKGSKEGVVNANFMVAISYNSGVVLCQQYNGHITGEKMANIIKQKFKNAFEKSVNSNTRRLLMDGCPRQNSKVALKALEDCGAMVFRIPPRSPDLNPIENFFGIISKHLQKQAVKDNITHETFQEFSTRVKDTMMSYPVDKINKIIESMDRRIQAVINKKGMRIKY